MPEKSVCVYRLKATILGIRPPVWRRILIAGDSSFDGLHRALQAAFGWSGARQYEFTVQDQRIAPSLREGFRVGGPAADASRVSLHAVLSRADKVRYVYDFGDVWRLTILPEAVLPPDGMQLPRCLGGRRRAPPEGVGGAKGYARFLEAMRSADDSERDALLLWATGGQPYDAERFDVQEANERMRDLPAL